MFEVQSVEENYWKMVNDIIHADETKFEVDQAIVWTRESKGKVVKKHGTIAAIVAPDRVPNKEDFPSLYGRHPESPNDIGKPRNGYSYVVRWKDGSISWPLAQYLSPTYVSDAVDTLEEVTEKVGKPLVEVFAEEKTHSIVGKAEAIAAKIPEEEWEASRIAKGVVEIYGGLDEPPGFDVKEVTFPIKDDLEDVEAQVERELQTGDKVAIKAAYDGLEPPYNQEELQNYDRHAHVNRFYGKQDGHDGDGHDIKTDSDPDRELGHHMRGAIRIMSEAFFGKRSNVTQEKLKEWQRNDDELWQKIRHLEEQLAHRNADVERLQERVKKEMSFQTETATQGDASVDKLRKEIEVLCQENEALTSAVSKLQDERGALSDNVEYWKSMTEEAVKKNDKLHEDLRLLRGGEVTLETSDISVLKDQLERYKNTCLELNKQIDNLESHAEKREEQIAAELEKIEKLEAEVKDFKTKNEILPDEAVEYLRSEVVRLQGELDTAKTTIEHYKNQAVRPKSGRKVTSDEETVKEAVRFSMNRVYRAMDDQYNVSDRQLEAMYGEWKDARK